MLHSTYGDIALVRILLCARRVALRDRPKEHSSTPGGLATESNSVERGLYAQAVSAE